MISESFDRRTLANMEIALDKACEVLSTGSEKHRTRRHIANRIIRCAKSGNRSLGSLTAAALAAAKELTVKRRRKTNVDTPAAHSLISAGVEIGLAGRFVLNSAGETEALGQRCDVEPANAGQM